MLLPNKMILIIIPTRLLIKIFQLLTFNYFKQLIIKVNKMIRINQIKMNKMTQVINKKMINKTVGYINILMNKKIKLNLQKIIGHLG